MTQRIGLLGGECTGKSILAHALERRLGACVVREYLREFVDTHGRVPVQQEQASVLRAQMEAEAAAARVCTESWLVGDPAPLMTAVYSEIYFDDRSLIAEGVAHAMNYDVLVWCDDDIPWVPDGIMRDGLAFRTSEQAAIERLLRESGLPATRVSGSLDERVSTVLRVCASVGPR